MNRITTFLFATLSLLLAALFSGTDPSYSCGPEPEYEAYRISYVDPDLLSDSIYQSFYRTLLQEHQATTWFAGVPEFTGWQWTTIKEKENVEDWSRYFGGKISAESIYDLFYNTTDSLIAPLLAFMEMKLPTTPYTGNRIIMREWEKEPDTLEVGEVLKEVVERNDIPFLRYFHYANECSRHAWTPDPWDGNPATQDTAAMLLLVRKGQALYNECTSDFLRLRYAYQIVRMARYAGEYRQAIELYDRLIPTNPTRSPIRYWALAHKAGAARLAGNNLLANYCFAQVFDSCEGEREISLRAFKVREQDEWNGLYRMAQNNHERATLWMLRGFKTRRLTFDYIREMYRLEPGSPRLAMAMMRELHRIESHLYDDREVRDWNAKKRGTFTRKEYGGDTVRTVRTNVAEDWGRWSQEISHNRLIARGDRWDTLVVLKNRQMEGNSEEVWDTVEILSGQEYVSSFRRFVMNLAQQGKVFEPGLWYMTAGYIDLMDHDFSVADECLEEAERAATGNDDLRRQIVLLDCMRRIKGKRKIDRDLENRMFPALQWLEQKQQKNGHSKYDKVMVAIGQQYLVQNDMPRAILAFARAGDGITTRELLDIYATHSDLERFGELIAGKGTTEYEQMLIGSISISKEGLTDLRATRLLREGEFREAYDLLKTIPASYRMGPPSNDYSYYGYSLPRYGDDEEFAPMKFIPHPKLFYSSADSTDFKGRFLRINDPTDSAQMPGRMFDKLTFVEELLRLQEEAKRNPRKADSAYMQTANLLFNTYAWSIADIGMEWTGEVDPDMEPNAFYPLNIRGVAERFMRIDRRRIQELKPRTLARTYYERAMKATRNRELAAHCAFMIDQSNKHPRTSEWDFMEVVKTQDRTGYNMLITKYRDTKFSQWILSQCSVYQYFERQRKGT